MIFKNHNFFRKTCVVKSLKEKIFIIHFMTYVVTHIFYMLLHMYYMLLHMYFTCCYSCICNMLLLRLFINHFASWYAYPHFSFKCTLIIPVLKPSPIVLSIMTSHMPIFLNCIHSFIPFQFIFCLLFPFQFALQIKPFSSFSMITLPCFPCPADPHYLTVSSFHL